MFFKKYGDIIVSIFFMIAGIALIALAKTLPASAVMSVGPDFMPTVIGLVTLILAIILLIMSIKGFKANAAKLEAEPPKSVEYKRVILSMLVILLYAFLLQTVGFIVLTLVYLPIQIFILAPDENRTKKDIILYLIISVIFTFVVFFLFRYGFKIMLPAGIFTINL